MVDAIHPGYGFLAENVDFARRCEEEGIILLVQTSDHLDMFGDKVKARIKQLAIFPLFQEDGPVANLEEVASFGRAAWFSNYD